MEAVGKKRSLKKILESWASQGERLSRILGFWALGSSQCTSCSYGFRAEATTKLAVPWTCPVCGLQEALCSLSLSALNCQMCISTLSYRELKSKRLMDRTGPE